jgi:hypothetical protein
VRGLDRIGARTVPAQFVVGQLVRFAFAGNIPGRNVVERLVAEMRRA